MSILIIKNVLVDNELKNILIENNLIKKISTNIDEDYFIRNDCKILDGKGKAAIPGFVNMHTHSAMTLFRGAKEDTKLAEWLNEIWLLEAKLDDELIYWGTKLACIEMIKTGTTCFFDQYWNIESAVKAIKEMGLRSIQSYVALTQNDNSKNETLKIGFEESYKASLKWGNANTFAVSVHAPYTVSDEMIVWCSNFAKEKGLKYHIHVSETEFENIESLKKYGCSPFERLDKLGVLANKNVIAAHCVWLSKNDIELMSKHNVTAVHNINSNLKLSSGYKFLYNELKERGVNVCLGTDGAASSNNLDMREAMKTAALLQKAWRLDPTAMPIEDVFKMATINGAKALGLNIGEIKEGKLADIVLIDVNNYAFVPNINFLSNLIYSANSSCIDTVICNGKIIMNERFIEGEQEILDNVNKIYKKLYYE